MTLSPYGTHLPLLLKVVAATKGDVLELGIGSQSTPALHKAVTEQGRKLVSYDTDSHYIVQYGQQYGGPLHLFHWISDWDSAEIEKPWSVVLVDHRPARRRYRDAARVALFAEYVVCHDTELENDRFYRWGRAFKHFEFRYDDSLKPRTTILSNLNNLDWLKGDNNGI